MSVEQNSQPQQPDPEESERPNTDGIRAYLNMIEEFTRRHPSWKGRYWDQVLASEGLGETAEPDSPEIAPNESQPPGTIEPPTP